MKSIRVPRTKNWSVSSLLSDTHKTALAREGYTQRVVHLLPHRESILVARAHGIKCDHWRNLCVGSTRGCRNVCLRKSGKLRLNDAMRAGFVRSYLWQSHRDLFLERLDAEITAFKRKCDDKPVIRLYGTHDGDILEDAPDIVAAHPDVMFNDYTKLDILTGQVAPNVYRVKSATELTQRHTFIEFAQRGLNHAVPFNVGKGEPLPLTYHGITVIDGDRDDLRFLDPEGVIVGLRFKASTHEVRNANNHGFVRNVPVPVSVG